MLADGVIGGIVVGCIIFTLFVVVPCALYKFAPAVLVRGATKAMAILAGLKTKQIDAGDFKWSYYESRSSSDPNQETIVLIHGYGTNKESWSSFARYLVRANYRVICPDVVGNGYTLPLECESYEVTKQVQRLDAFLSAVMGEGEKFHLGGLSMGGHISGVYAATYPHKVSSLLLMCPAGAKGERLSKLAEDTLVYG
jgi:abhydrolase domain-containing protein 6